MDEQPQYTSSDKNLLSRDKLLAILESPLSNGEMLSQESTQTSILDLIRTDPQWWTSCGRTALENRRQLVIAEFIKRPAISKIWLGNVSAMPQLLSNQQIQLIAILIPRLIKLIFTEVDLCRVLDKTGLDGTHSCQGLSNIMAIKACIE